MAEKVVHIDLEATIGAGKSTFLEKIIPFLKKYLPEGTSIETYPEPIDVWKSFGSEKTNLLELMYKKENYSFVFQLVAALSKQSQLSKMSSLSIVERSILAQKYIFVPLLRESGKISQLEREILDDLVDVLLPLHGLKPDLILYLKCDVETAYSRIQNRGREEETAVTIEYLESIGKKYDHWMSHETDIMIYTIDVSEEVNYDRIAKNLAVLIANFK